MALSKHVIVFLVQCAKENHGFLGYIVRSQMHLVLFFNSLVANLKTIYNLSI